MFLFLNDSETTCSSDIYKNNPFNTRCEYITVNDCHGDSKINFYHFYFCGLKENLFVSIPLCIILLYLFLILIIAILSGHLSTSLTKLAKVLRMSEMLAAVTLVALGNGALDVITGIIASGSGDPANGIFFSIGTLGGACIFVGTMVGGLVVMISKSQIQIKPFIMIRNAAFQIISFGTLLLFLFIGKINLIMAIIYVFIYLIYVIFVVIGDYFENRKKKKVFPILKANIKQIKIESTSKDNDPAKVNNENIANSEKEKEIKFDPQIEEKTSISDPLLNPINIEKEKKESNMNAKLINERKSKFQSAKFKMKSAVKMIAAKWRLLKIIQKGSAEANEEKEGDDNEEEKWEDKNLFYKIRFIMIDFIFYWIRYVTIFPEEEEKWSKIRALINPICSLFFILWVFDAYSQLILNIHIEFWVAGLAVIFSLIIFFLTDFGSPPRFMWIFTILALIISVFWAYIFADIVVDIIEIVGVITGLPVSILGLSVIAIANSLDDMVVDFTLALKGFGRLAIYATSSGPTFYLLVGLGGAIIRTVISNGTIIFPDNSHCLLSKMILAGAVILITLNLISSIINKFILGKRYGITCLILYICFLLFFYVYVLCFYSNTD